ncbi:MAG: OprO/OprP family phosphate-selective porin [Azoarcus sp.]|nr:OprO/OprP family phosphate-selective porin [Azoarcus sp.]
MTHKTIIAMAVSGLLASPALGADFAAEAPRKDASSVRAEDLRRQIETLQQSIHSLQKQVETLQQEGKDRASSSDIEGVRTDLENYKYDQERQYERKNAKSTRDTTLYGTVQVRYQAQNRATRSGNPAPNGERYHTFDVPTALLGVRGNLYKDYVEGKNLEYQFSLSYGKRADGTNNANFNLQDAFIRYNFLPTTDGLEGNRLTATIGQQLLPFGIEAQAAEDLRPTINLATAPAQLGLFNRQVGAVFRGDVSPFVDYTANYRAPLFEYALGVVNGSYSNKLDSNNGKAVVGRGAFTLPVDYASWLRELKIGASFYKGSKVVVGTLGGSSANLDSHGRQDIYGFDIYYNHAPYGVTYEHWQGRADYAAAANSAQTREARSAGYTLTLFYTFGDQFFNSVKTAAKFDDSWPQSIQTFYRFDYFNPNRSRSVTGIRGKGLDAVHVHTLGFNWFFAETTKLQFGINRYRYEHETNTQKAYSEVQTQLQYTF